MSRHVAPILTVLFTLASNAQAGPQCGEGGGDAGSTRATARVCSGSGGVLLEIVGDLPSVRGADDFEDMYVIRITDPMNFSASTVGELVTDTQLWLFRPDSINKLAAYGLLANDEAFNGSGSSHLGPTATDGTGQTIPGAGVYLLAITGFNNDPLSAGGAIFNQVSRTEISGPDGPGGAGIHTGWTGGGVAVGTYTINLTGAEVISLAPAMTPASGAFLASALVAAGLIVFRRAHA